MRACCLTITLDDVRSGTPEVVKSVVDAGGLVLVVYVVRPSLEEAYLKKKSCLFTRRIGVRFGGIGKSFCR
jgi:hypothetical protein